MNQYYPHIFEPMKVGNTIFKNRILNAPSSMKDLGAEDLLTDNNISYYRMIAKGGAANVTLGDVIVHPTGCVDYSYKVKMFNRKNLSRFYDLTTAVKQMGAIPSIEFDHAGAHFTDRNRINYGVSYIEKDMFGNEVLEMDKDLISEIIDAYGQAAYNAKYYGFEMCLVHAGHGWLIHEFLSPVWNRRTDEFGGSIENRCRFGVMVVEKIREYCGKDFPIEVRISHSEGVQGGTELEDAIAFAQALEGKADMIHVTHGSLNDSVAENYSMPPWFLPRNLNVEAAAEIKKHVSMPVGVVGAIDRPDEIEQFLAEGKIDYVVLCRGLIADPEFPNKAKSGHADEITPCIRCNTCISCGYDNTTLKCSVNPIIGLEKYHEKPKLPATPQKILIAGGGPAGIQAAIFASKQGHQVVLCEQSDELFGLLRYADKEPFKEDLTFFKKHLLREIERSAVEIRYNTKVTPEYVKKECPDQLFVAIGGDVIVPPIPGVEKGIPILDIYKGKAQVTGNKLVILGGGMTGCEAAIGFAMQGKDVTLVEMRNDVLIGAGFMQISILKVKMKEYGVKVLTGTKCTQINEFGIECVDHAGNAMQVASDQVILSTGLSSRTEEALALMNAAENARCLGDCHKIGFILQATRNGYDAAMNL
ncbi:MAG: FAD-dependent oxidoreductase [Anaerofustis sp.]